MSAGGTKEAAATSGRAAVFDVDRTLIDGMTGFVFSRYLLRHANLSAWAKLRIASAVFRYRTRLSPEEVIVEIGVTVYAGKSVDDLKRWAAACVKEELAGRCYVEALERIAKHREAGDHVLLASGSSEFIVGALAEHVGAHGFVATAAHTNSGRGTRRVKVPLCYKEGKLELVREYLKARGLSLSESTVYTDNAMDLSLLVEVNEPVAVNAREPELIRAVEQNGWRSETWNTPVNPNHTVTGTSFPIR